MVRELTSKWSASQRALRGRGATTRSSSTRANRGSVRFTHLTVGAGADRGRS